MYTMPSVREQHELHFTFALPSLFDAYMTKPDELLSHLVGHEGEGSLLSALKVKGWATKLSAGVADGGHERSSAAWLFQTTITLTVRATRNPHTPHEQICTRWCILVSRTPPRRKHACGNTAAEEFTPRTWVSG